MHIKVLLLMVLACGFSNGVLRGQSLVKRGEMLENLFNVYDPSFLGVVWPKIANGVHLVVGHECWDDVSDFFRDLAEGRAWAYRAVDASGRYQPGLFGGNLFWLGSKDECAQLDNEFKRNNESIDEFDNSDYLNVVLRREKEFDGAEHEWRDLVQRDELMQRLVAADGAPPAPLAFTAVQVTVNITKVTMIKSHDITLGVCLPRSCSASDVASIINFSIMINDNFKASKNIPRAVKITSVRPVQNSYDISNDLTAIVLISITIFLIVLAVTATVVEFGLIKCKRPSKSMTFDLQNYNNNINETDKQDNRKVDTLPRKEGMDVESLTTNNMNNSNNNNINLVTVKKIVKSHTVPPSITLDVVSMEQGSGSCKRCGKYRKQCNNPKQLDNLPACPRFRNNSSVTSLNTDYKKSHSFAKSLLLCFSLNYSWKRIFNTNMANKDLSLIHILKVVATLWIIFVHVSIIVNYISDNGGDVNEYNNIYNIIATGTLSFDTLFFVSGLFSAHHFFFLKSQYSVEELVSFGGGCGHLLQYVCFVTNRAIRLLPSYLYVIFLTAVLSRASRATSVISSPDSYHDNCQMYWWRNLLYITNLYPKEQRCMQISWYLSVESQLHALGALCCALASRARAWAALALVLMLGTTAMDVAAAYRDYSAHLYDALDLYGAVVERGWARACPYLLGVLAGALAYAARGKIRLGKLSCWTLWLTSLISLWSSLAAGAWGARGAAGAGVHAAWPLALLWPCVACATKHAGCLRSALTSPLLAGISRISYSMLLLHGVLARYLLLNLQVSLCSNTLCLFSVFAGTTVLTTLSALLLSLLVEMPICSLLRRLSDCAT